MNEFLHKLNSAIKALIMFSIAILLIESCVKEDETRASGRSIAFSVDESLNDNSQQPKSKADDCATYGEFVGAVPMGYVAQTKAVGTPLDDIPKLCIKVYVSDIKDDIADSSPTRGSILNKQSFFDRYKAEGFGMFGYQHSSDSYTPGAVGNSLTMGKPSDGAIVTYDNTNRVWSGWADFSAWNNDRMTFFAYAPRAVPRAMGNISVEENNGAPIVKYDTWAESTDFLYARKYDVEKPADYVVPLTFNHATTAVYFRLGPNFKVGKIGAITLKKIKAEGGFNINTASWVLSDNAFRRDFIFSVNKSYTASDAFSQTLISGAKDIMFMIPQTFSDSTSKIEFEYLVNNMDSNSALLFAAPLSAFPNKWEQGKRITYVIDCDIEEVAGPKLEVADIPTIDYLGASNVPIAITSQLLSKKDNHSLVDKVPWSVEFSYDEGKSYSPEAPDWLSITRDASTGNASLTIARGKPLGIDWDDAKGTEDTPYVLSTNGGTTPYSPANCYIINGPGWYRLPLVYGKGQVPTSLSKKENPFVNSEGNQITNPNIYMMQAGEYEGVLIWQDAKDLVKNVICNLHVYQYPSWYYEGDRFLKFQVPAASIRQGNAVIAIKIDGDIAWSWHIWVTDYKLGVGDIHIKTAHGRDAWVMPYSLGECHAVDATTYPERKCKVKFIQQDSGLEVIKDVVSPMATTARSTDDNNAVYYQWGRKDPFPGCADYISRPYGEKTTYDADGAVGGWYTSSQAGYVSMSLAILHPNVFFRGKARYDPALRPLPEGWYSGSIPKDKNLWHYGESSIYDPSPAGYCVPGGDYGEFTKTWDSETYSSVCSNGLVFPAFGHRDYNTGSLNVRTSSSSYYWSTNTFEVRDYRGPYYGLGLAGILAFGDEQVVGKATGCTVRPVRIK